MKVNFTFIRNICPDKAFNNHIYCLLLAIFSILRIKYLSLHIDIIEITF